MHRGRQVRQRGLRLFSAMVYANRNPTGSGWGTEGSEGGISAEAYIKQSVILNYPLSSVATKHPVDVISPTHCLWLPTTQTPSTAHSLLPLQCHYV